MKKRLLHTWPTYNRQQKDTVAGIPNAFYNKFKKKQVDYNIIVTRVTIGQATGMNYLGGFEAERAGKIAKTSRGLMDKGKNMTEE
jgi:hypothetical protein